MIRVFADNYQLDLADNPAIEVQLNSPIVGITQQGSVVYPFSCPFTANNDDIFSFFRLPESSIDRTKTFVGRIYDDSLLIMEGILSIKKTETSYSIEIAGPPAGVSETFWNKAINQVDIGSHEFDIKGVTTNLYGIKITSETQGWFAISRSNLKIKTSSRVFVDYTFPINDNSINPSYNSGNSRSFGERIQPVAYAFNEDNNLRDEGYELVVSKSGLVLFVPDSVTNTLDLKIVITAQVSSEFGGTSIVVKEFDFTRVTYLAPILSDLQNRNTLNSAFVFPTIYNPGFYSETNKIWSKYVNFFDGISYKENTFRHPTEFTLVPMMSLHYVVGQFLTLMNYTPHGAFFNDADFQKLIIENTKSIDKQCETIDWAFNVYSTKFQYKDHLPKISIKDFFDELKLYFGLTIEYDFINRNCTIDFIQPIIESTENEDFTNKVGKIISLETSTVKKIQFAYENSYVPDADKLHEINVPYPEDSLVEENPDEYTILKSKINSLPVLDKYPSSESSILQEQINLNSGIGLNITLTEPLRIYPYCNQLGNSGLYSQDKQDFGFRLLIFEGKQTGPLNTDIIRSDNSSETLNLSLSATDTKSRYNRFLKSYQYYLENAVEAETDVFLNDAELAAFDWRKKKYIRGIHYLVHQLLPTLPIRHSFKMKMKRTV